MWVSGSVPHRGRGGGGSADGPVDRVHALCLRAQARQDRDIDVHVGGEAPPIAQHLPVLRAQAHQHVHGQAFQGTQGVGDGAVGGLAVGHQYHQRLLVGDAQDVLDPTHLRSHLHQRAAHALGPRRLCRQRRCHAGHSAATVVRHLPHGQRLLGCVQPPHAHHAHVHRCRCLRAQPRHPQHGRARFVVPRACFHLVPPPTIGHVFRAVFLRHRPRRIDDDEPIREWIRRHGVDPCRKRGHWLLRPRWMCLLLFSNFGRRKSPTPTPTTRPHEQSAVVDGGARPVGLHTTGSDRSFEGKPRWTVPRSSRR